MNGQELRKDIDALIQWVHKQYRVPPYTSIRIAIDHGRIFSGKEDKRIPLQREKIFTIEQYSNEYYHLKKKGYSWVNIQCAGIAENILYCVLEHSSQFREDSLTTSVNFSGPFKIAQTSEPDWEFMRYYVFI